MLPPGPARLPGGSHRGALLTRLLYGAAGLLLLTASGVLVSHAAACHARAARADGRVVALRAGGSHPTIRFDTPDGTLVEFDANGLIFGCRPDDKVQVLYNPADPQRSGPRDGFGSGRFCSPPSGSFAAAALSG